MCKHESREVAKKQSEGREKKEGKKGTSLHISALNADAGGNVSVTRARARRGALNYGRRDTLFTAFLSIVPGRVNVQCAASLRRDTQQCGAVRREVCKPLTHNIPSSPFAFAGARFIPLSAPRRAEKERRTATTSATRTIRHLAHSP